MQTKFVHFRKRDKKGRRLAIFARAVSQIGEFDKEIPPPDSLEILVFTCSLDDQFSKKKGYELYDQFGKNNPNVHPERFLIPIVDNKPLKSFINWANDTFYTYTVLEVAATLPIIWRSVGDEIEAYEVGKTEVIKVIDKK